MTTTTPPKTHNLPPHMVAFQTIDDLYEEAKNWADGEPIASQEMHDAITKLRADIHEAGKEAESLRVAQKKPYDDAIAEIQSIFNPYVQKDKGKVDRAKKALDELLASWRVRVAAEKAAEAARIAKEAEEARAKAEAAIRATSGNLEAREEAEEALAEAKKLERQASKADKAANTGLGLRTVWECAIQDEEAALTWAYDRNPAAFLALVLDMAREQVRAGKRELPGIKIWSEKVAR